MIWLPLAQIKCMMGSFFKMRYNWHRTVSLRYTTCWFDTYCNMMTTILLTNISILSRNCHFIFVMGTFAIWSLSNLEVCDAALLTIITVLYIKSPQLLHLLVTSLCPWTASPQLPLFLAPGDHTVSTLCLWISLSQIPHISDDMHCLSLSDLFDLAMPSSFIRVVALAGFYSFSWLSNTPRCVCAFHIFSIHLSSVGCLGCFCILATVNRLQWIWEGDAFSISCFHSL